jgi:hypothetical protein
MKLPSSYSVVPSPSKEDENAVLPRWVEGGGKLAGDEIASVITLTMRIFL